MGYTTDFEGQFDFDRPLDDDTYKLLTGLATTRRMQRNIKGYGIEGEFFFDEKDFDNCGQTADDTVIDYNKPPRTQPSLWLQWIPTEDRLHLEWDGNEKFYRYVEWLKYLIQNIFNPRGYVLNGEVDYYGEDREDFGRIVIKNNIVSVLEGKTVYVDANKEKVYTLTIAVMGTDRHKVLDEAIKPVLSLNHLDITIDSMDTKGTIEVDSTNFELLKLVAGTLQSTTLKQDNRTISQILCVVEEKKD